MNLREIVFNKLKETNRLDLWPKARIEIFSMESQGVCDKYLELFNKGYKCKNTINSLVAYILGICDDEPIGEMTVVRPPKLADIDSDFDSARREEVIDFIKEWFGGENVSQIATYGQYKLTSAISSILKYKMSSRGEDPSAALTISATVPYDIENMDLPMDQKFDLLLEASQELLAYLKKYPDERELIEGIIGAYSSIGKHAAGVVIGPEPIYKIAPMAATSKGPVTAMDKKDIEAMGLMKFDILGVANMSKIAICLQLINERHGIDIVLGKDIDFNDKKCLARFNAGDVDTIFQFETPSFQEIFVNQVEVDSFNDLIVINALNRPGPKKFISDKFYERYRTKEPDEDGNMDTPVSTIGTYSSNKKHSHMISSPHPLLESVLKETYGIPVYQEQIMRMVQVLSGASMTEADTLRDAIGKKNFVLFDKCVQRFSKGCRERGIEENVIVEVISLIRKFGKYGFNKSHAAAYAIIGFWNMWLKTYYPAEWYTAVFTVEFSGTSKKSNMLNPCYAKGTSLAGKYSQNFKRKLDWYIYGASSGGFNGEYKRCFVYTPSLNISHHQKAMIHGENNIYLPFSIIEGLGGNMLSVVENRKLLPDQKYDSIKSFVEYSGISEGISRKLIDNQVFEDDFGSDIPKIHAELTYYLKVRQEERKASQQRIRKTSVKIDDGVQKLLFDNFKGVNSIQLLNDVDFKPAPEIRKKSSKSITIDNSWF